VSTERRTPLLDEDEPEEAGEADEEDGVVLEGQRGILEPGQINAVLKKHSSELVACYSEVGKLAYVGGTVELKLRVGVDGAVRTAQVAESDLGAWAAEKCLLEVARRMQFPKPRGGGDAELSFPLELPARSAAAVADEQRGSELDKKLAELASCGDPGAVQVTVYVGIKGVITSAGFATTSDPPFADEWGDCALAKLLSLKLSDPRGRVVKASSSYGAQ
jgi:hypothetical protein